VLLANILNNTLSNDGKELNKSNDGKELNKPI